MDVGWQNGMQDPLDIVLQVYTSWNKNEMYSFCSQAFDVVFLEEAKKKQKHITNIHARHSFCPSLFAHCLLLVKASWVEILL